MFSETFCELYAFFGKSVCKGAREFAFAKQESMKLLKESFLWQGSGPHSLASLPRGHHRHRIHLDAVLHLLRQVQRDREGCKRNALDLQQGHHLRSLLMDLRHRMVTASLLRLGKVHS